MKPPYRIFVMTSDKYLPALRPFAWLLNKYWIPMPDVIVAGFTEPRFQLPTNFNFLSLGRQMDYPFNKWSDALSKLLNDMKDEVFILMLEDYWLTRPVNTHAVEIMYYYMLQFQYVIKFDLCADRLYAFGADLEYGHVSYLDLIKSMPGSPYHLSLMPGLWRKEHLLRQLVPGESPHDIELIGTTRLSHDQNVIVLGTRQWPVRITLGLRGGDHSKLLLDGISKEDIDQMRNAKYFETWEGKGV